MIIPFEHLPDHSRIWIYQSNRILTASEQDHIIGKVNGFIESWTAHGADLTAGFAIKNDIFCIVGLDEGTASATGCSIDKLTALFKSLESELNISLFDRQLIALKNEHSVHLVRLSKLKKRIEQDEVEPGQLFFNNTVQNKADLSTNWLIPLGNSWLARFFTQKEPF